MSKLIVITALLTAFSLNAQPDTLVHFELIEKRTGSLTVINKVVNDSISSQNSFTSLTDVLRSETPIFIRNYGPGGIASLQLGGGTPQQTQLLWNGMAINYPGLGLSDPNIIPLGMIGGVDILYGNSSQVYGSGGIGGAINLKPRQTNKNAVGIQTLLGSFGEKSYNAEAGLLHKKIQTSIGVGRYEARNDFSYLNIAKINRPVEIQQHAAVEREFASANVRFYPDQKGVISFNGFYTHSYRQIPPSLLINSSANLDDVMGLGQISYERNFTRWKSESFIGFYHQKQLYSDSTSEIFDTAQSQNFQFKTTWQRNFLSKKMVWRSALTSTYQLLSTNAYLETKKNIQALISTFVSYQWNSRNMSFLHVQYEYNQSNLSLPSPILGHEYRLSKKKNASVIAFSVGQNFRFPTFNDLYWQPGGNLNLKPELSHSASTSLTCFPEKKLSWTNEIYVNRTQQAIRWLPTNGIWQAQNIELQRQAGFRSRVKAHFQLFKQLKIETKMGYEAVYSQIKQDENDWKIAPFIPLHNYQTSVSFTYKKLTVNYKNQLNSRYYSNFENSIFMPAVDLHSVAIFYKLAFPFKKGSLKKMEFNSSFNVLNLGDKMYQNSPYFPMPGRSFQLSLQLRYA